VIVNRFEEVVPRIPFDSVKVPDTETAPVNETPAPLLIVRLLKLKAGIVEPVTVTVEPTVV